MVAVTSKEYLEEIRKVYMQIKPENEERPLVQLAAQQLVKAGYNSGAVMKVVKQLTGFGFNVRQVQPPKQPTTPAPTLKKVRQAVEREVSKEALHAIREA